MKKLFSRFTFIALTIILTFIVDVLLVFTGIYILEQILEAAFPVASRWISLAVTAVGWLIVFITVLNIANRDMVPETKVSWLITVIVLNVFGVAIYAVFSHNRPSRRNRRRFAALYERTKPFLYPVVSDERLSADWGRWAGLSTSLRRSTSLAIAHTGTKTEYFATGELFFERLKEDLEGAKNFIFLEYFVVARGVMWNAILDILTRKAAEGVEVRMLYDDIGCMGKLRAGYARGLRKRGIKCVKFSPFVPVVSNVHNNRDHRKIAVIDGTIGYTGGINLADEYVNATHPFGHWKDTAIRMEGEGVKSLVLMFLQTYNFREKQAEDFTPYLSAEYPRFEGEGYVQPYGDGPRPLYERSIGEDVYLNIINEAKEYVYITTPYLIIDHRLREALLQAAGRGVDVRIVTPHIPDKKIPFALTRSNYMPLIKGGVKIYEYTPGFIHAKSFLADGEIGVVGTINLDYRSFLHHFENAVLMFQTRALIDLKRDFEETFEVSALQTEADAKKSVVWRGLCEVAKAFAPLF